MAKFHPVRHQDTHGIADPWISIPVQTPGVNLHKSHGTDLGGVIGIFLVQKKNPTKPKKPPKTQNWTQIKVLMISRFKTLFFVPAQLPWRQVMEPEVPGQLGWKGGSDATKTAHFLEEKAIKPHRSIHLNELRLPHGLGQVFKTSREFSNYFYHLVDVLMTSVEKELCLHFLLEISPESV